MITNDTIDGKAIDEALVKYEAIIYYQIHRLNLYRKFRSYFDDFVQEGRMAIVSAMNTYDPDKGTKLTTYINILVRNSILNYVKYMKLYQYDKNLQFDDNSFIVDEDPLDSLIVVITHLSDEKEQPILIDYFVHSIKQAEIAAKYDISQQWVSHLVNKFRERVKNEWF